MNDYYYQRADTKSMSRNIGIPTNTPRYNGKCSKCGKDIEDWFIHYRVDTSSRTAVAEYWYINCVRRA